MRPVSRTFSSCKSETLYPLDSLILLFKVKHIFFFTTENFACVENCTAQFGRSEHPYVGFGDERLKADRVSFTALLVPRPPPPASPWAQTRKVTLRQLQSLRR